MSCISALDDVIAEFDDPSLPYIYEDEGGIPQEQQTTKVVNSSQSQIVPSSSGEQGKYFPREDKLVLKNEKANHTPLQVQHVSDSSTTSTSKSSANPNSHHSHLIQIPIFSSKSSKPEAAATQVDPTICLEKVISPRSSSTSTPSSLSSKLPGRPSVVPRTSSDTSSNSKVSKSGIGSGDGSGVVGVGGACGGTYSKGTNQEIILPRIPSSSDKSSVGSSSSRNSHVQKEPIYSSVGKSRPQLSLGMYTSQTGHLYPPQEPEIDYNEEADATQTTSAPVYNTNDHNGHERLSVASGSGRLSKSSSSGGVGTSVSQTTKEQWNFPSEKNLPRSLRKTRKTCFLDDSTNGSESEKSDGKLNNESDGEGHSIGGHSSASEQELHPKQPQHNVRNAKVDDKRKIYEDIVLMSSSSNGGKANNLQHHQARENNTGLVSSSFTFNIFNSGAVGNSSSNDTPMPKPRLRQQIPKVDEISQLKYPPLGKIPKPNPKPVAGQNQIDAPTSSPISPVQCEITRTEDDEKVVNVSKVGNEVNVNNGNSLGSTNNNGHMMRMMMMMKGTPSSKNNSTGSASSISRSSSSSSGGDPNYYRKDNLSSSSGVVVTTNSSTTTASPTHSVSNNNLLLNNNNVTIIHSEKESGGGSSVKEVKGQSRQQEGSGQRQSTGSRSSNGGGVLGHSGPHHNTKPNTTVTLTNGVLEVDDGYLSMINRNEVPLLWPEEFIENETFSPDELKRLSVHLPEEDEDDDSSPQDSDSCSEKEIELEIVDYEIEPSRRQPHNLNPPLKSSSSGRRHVPEKAEYFSDDSLEGDREEELTNFVKKKNRGGFSSVSPYVYPNNDCSNSNSHRSKNVAGLLSNSSPSRPYYRQQITVNTAAMVTPVKQGQISRIPKMIGGGSNNKGRANSSSSPDVKEKLPKRKPCSFFVSLTDEGSAGGGEVNSISSQQHKSSSLPMGSKVTISSPVKINSVRENKSAVAPSLTFTTSNLQVDSKSTSTTTAANNMASSKHYVGSSLPQPQLRHTKSINTGAPRCTTTTVNNANKRKSTSDLVTVLDLNQQSTDIPPQLDHHKTPKQGSVNDGISQNLFNRTSTFLISSSPTCSRTVGDDLHLNQTKRSRDDETDNDEDDFSSDFDILSSTDAARLEPDSLQPLLSLTDVHDFVSEIMDTALRQEIKRTQMVLNNYPSTDIDSTNSQQLIEDNLQNANQEELFTPSPEKGESSEQLKKTLLSSCDNDDQSSAQMVQFDGEERARVDLQFEAVVSTFLSDNQRFLFRGESQEGCDRELKMVPVGDDGNECDDKGPITPTIHTPIKDSLNEQERSGSSVVDDKEDNAGLMVTNLNLPPTEEDSPLPQIQPVMNSTPLSAMPIANVCNTSSTLRDSSLVGEEKILDVEEETCSSEEDSEEQPPAFIPTPPPHHILPQPTPLPQANIVPSGIFQQKHFQPGFISTNGNLHNLHNSNVRDGKAALDILAERINNSKKFSTNPDDQLQVSQFIHDKRNIWAMYDRPFDEDLLTVNNPGVRGYASRSQENLMDAMTKERYQKSFNSRGQSSTLPLNCRPPSSQRRSSTFRNMFNKFRKSKPSGPVIKEIPEYRDDEIQSITSRETGPSEQGKKRGFFSRLFRRSRKN